MAVLHVAGLPFPTRQGTQAAIASMLSAVARARRPAHLLTYGVETGFELAGERYNVHRAARLAGRDSLRSGPSLRKLMQDASLARAARALADVLPARVLVGHHVEGAAACLATGRPTVFFAHTDLADELPSYLPRLPAAVPATLGGGLDRALVHRCAAVATISPLLRARLIARCPGADERVRYVPLPWPLPAAADPGLRARARRGLGLDDRAQVALYIGNLDAYQGLDVLLQAIALARRRMAALCLLVATDSNASALRERVRACGLGAHVHVTSMGRGAAPAAEATRARLHAAADVVVVPRASRGGLPIKLLDALARGAPTLAMPAACAGIDFGDALHVAPGDDAHALGESLAALLAAPARLRALSAAGRSHVLTHHGDAAFLHALDACCDRAMCS